MAPPRRTSSTRTHAKGGTAPLPKGARVPQPMLAYWIMRAIVISALVLFFTSPSILAWAAAHTAASVPAGQQHGGLLSGLLHQRPTPTAAAGSNPRPTTDATTGNTAAAPAQLDPVAPLLASAVLAILTPHIVADLGKIGILGVSLMLGEALLACWGMWQQRRSVPRIPTTYLLVRASMPGFSPNSGRMAGAATPSGDQFFRAIQQAIPVGSRSERFRGTAPWVAFTLTGIPNKPIEMGVVVADPQGQRRRETAMAIRAIIQGQLPGTQIDELPDPFLAELRPGATVAWREYGLQLPSQYPLRFLDDIAGSDLLGPLASTLAPRGTLRTEAQIIVRPATSWVLNWGWRGHATALLLKLQSKADYALTDDTKTIEAKLDAAPFEVTVRIAAVADGADATLQLDMELNGIAEVLGQYHQRTSHHLQTLVQIDARRSTIVADRAPLAVYTRAPRFAPPPELLLPLRTWRQSDILTSIEIAGFWHPPTAGLSSLIRWLPCKIIPPPPHAYIPPGRTDRITVGMARRADGTIGPVGLTLRDMRPPMHIIAGMGGGKTRALANISEQCIPYGFFELDGKGDDQGGSLAINVRSYIPLKDEHRLIIFDILDTDWPIGLNPLAGIDLTRPGARDQALGQIMAIFARLDPSTWGKAPAMKEFVQMATLLVLEGEATPTLAHVKQCLLDAHYRETLLPHCTNPDVLTFWTITFPDQGEQQRTSLHALLRRFSQLLTTETTRYMVSQPASRLNILNAIEEGMIVLVPLPHVTLGELASAVAMLTLQQFVRAAFSRPGDDQTRTTYPLIIDELQIFIGKDGDSTDIQNAITQLRGLGIAGIYAHQTLDQLGELENEMLTNSGSRIIIRTQEPDASTLAKLYAASGITANDIANQDENEHQYAVLRCDGERTGLFSMMVRPWPKPLPITVEPYHAPNWQTLVPPDSPDPQADAALLRLIYGTFARPANVVQSLAEYTDEDWTFVLERWEAIRVYHRQYILDNPGCIALDESITDADPEIQAARRAAKQRFDRQMWLSRLLVATPRVLAAAEYARIRRQIEPEGGAALVERGRGRGKGRQEMHQPIIVQTRQGAVVMETPEQLVPEPVVPIGYVNGAVPTGANRPVPAHIPDHKTAHEVLRERGQQGIKNAEVEPGFEDL